MTAPLTGHARNRVCICHMPGPHDAGCRAHAKAVERLIAEHLDAEHKRIATARELIETAIRDDANGYRNAASHALYQLSALLAGQR